MIITKKTTEPEFNPVTIEITFETERELRFVDNLIGNMSNAQATSIANETGGCYTTTEAHYFLQLLIKAIR